MLEKNGINVTIRREMGRDIDGACGQLRKSFLTEEQKGSEKTLWKACALTDTGRVRTANQDYVYASVEPVGSLPNLFVVADGMGGHQAGDVASRYIVENLVSYLQYTENSQIVPLLREAILKVNTMLYHEAKEKPEFSGMGTTLVAAVADENTLYVANVGRQPPLSRKRQDQAGDEGPFLCGGTGFPGPSGARKQRL